MRQRIEAERQAGNVLDSTKDSSDLDSFEKNDLDQMTNIDPREAAESLEKIKSVPVIDCTEERAFETRRPPEVPYQIPDIPEAVCTPEDKQALDERLRKINETIITNLRVWKIYLTDLTSHKLFGIKGSYSHNHEFIYDEIDLASLKVSGYEQEEAKEMAAERALDKIKISGCPPKEGTSVEPSPLPPIEGVPSLPSLPPGAVVPKFPPAEAVPPQPPATTPPPTQPPPPKLDKTSSRILDNHNAERALVGAPPLHWNPMLAQHAADYAMVLATTGQLVHAPREGRGIERENIEQASIGWPAEHMTDQWVAEKMDFMPGLFPNVSRTGDWSAVAHYTQMIWPTTTDLGCGTATGSGHEWLVCRYSPGGNKDGQPVGVPPAQAAIGTDSASTQLNSARGGSGYCWIDSATGQPVNTYPQGTSEGLDPNHRSRPTHVNADGSKIPGKDFVRVPCPPPAE